MIGSLKEVVSINGKEVCDFNVEKDLEDLSVNGGFSWERFHEFKNKFPISIDHDEDIISFKMLTKPAHEGGDLRQCQWSDLVMTGLEMLKYLDNKFPCRENALTITKLEEALMWNDKRTQDRTNRNVEGKNLN